MLELAILGLLKQQPMHGYQLSRELGDGLGGFWRVSYGSLYPTLRRLERDGFVAPVPGESTGGRRKKTVFGITEQGERAFLDLLQETPNDSSTEDARFRVRLAFFRYLPPETRIRLLERRRAFLHDRLRTIDDSLRTTKRGTDGYTRSLIEHGRAATRSDIDWLDGLIDGERTNMTTTDPAHGGARSRRTAVLSRKGHSA